jgi:hypothetical protein
MGTVLILQACVKAKLLEVILQDQPLVSERLSRRLRNAAGS